MAVDLIIIIIMVSAIFVGLKKGLISWHNRYSKQL